MKQAVWYRAMSFALLLGACLCAKRNTEMVNETLRPIIGVFFVLLFIAGAAVTWESANAEALKSDDDE